jgi:ornithine cyclodeaminase
VTDLAAAVTQANLIATTTTTTTTTMARDPLIRGAGLRPGQHLDLICAYRADLREACDTALRAARGSRRGGRTAPQTGM